jgi:hypothetical protein
MLKNFVLTLCSALSFMLLTSACQSLPGFNLFSSGSESNQAAPHSNFVAAQQVLQARVGQPVAIETHHAGVTPLATVAITINGQPAAGEAASFPRELAIAQVLERGQPAQASLQALTFPADSCKTLLQSGGPAQRYTINPEYPVSALTLCHVWTAIIPGTYELSIAATDTAGHTGDSIHQWIEVR